MIFCHQNLPLVRPICSDKCLICRKHVHVTMRIPRSCIITKEFYGFKLTMSRVNILLISRAWFPSLIPHRPVTMVRLPIRIPVGRSAMYSMLLVVFAYSIHEVETLGSAQRSRGLRNSGESIRNSGDERLPRRGHRKVKVLQGAMSRSGSNGAGSGATKKKAQKGTETTNSSQTGVFTEPSSPW